ncbi:protein FAM111A-like [Poecilia formosa]|uniref:protein FAM111A-like n=1 Tax=Poecilia formosa TaxID=48698 RepID=UPI0007BA4B84|nr:PREDICTED: protein FAM111A-like [Poecilia formosa]
MSSKKKTSKQNHTEKTPTIKTEDDVGSSCSKPTEVPQIKEQVRTEEKDVKREEIGTSEMNSKMVKTEDMEESEASKQDHHLHSFTVKFGSDPNEYSIDCTKPCTVLQAIKSQHNTELQSEMDKSQKKIKKEKIKVSEENIIIKVGKGNDSPMVATHFPCCCVEENQCLTIMIMDSAVEKRREELSVLPKENYSVFFIDKELGEGNKYKRDMVFACEKIPANCKYFCVYGRKKMTVEKALRQDGRFVDDLTDFSLSDNENKNFRNHTAVVDNLDGKKFKMCKLPPKTQPKAKNSKQGAGKQDPTQQTNHKEQNQQAKVSASTSGQKKSETITVLEFAAKSGVSLKKAMEELGLKNISHEEINDLLQKQFPKLKAWMERRFPGRSFEKTLKLKRENFGKIQNSFSEVHTVRGLLDLSKSICLLMIEEKNNSGLTELKKTVQGTGFVLFDNFVLTNVHLFEPWEKMNNWVNYLTITAEFSFESKGKPGMKYQATVVRQRQEGR